MLLFLYILHNFCLQVYIFNMLYNCEHYILYCLKIFIILQTVTVSQWLLKYFLCSCVWSLKFLLLSFMFSSLWQNFLKESERYKRGTKFIQFLKIKWIGIFLQYLDRLFTMLVYAFTCSLRWAQKSTIGSIVLLSGFFLASTSVHL